MKKDLNIILKYTKENNGCLEWTKCYNTDGYPRASFDGYENGKVHRVVWELFNKKSAKGYVIRHTCDNPRCINPNHLLIGTNYDNIQDRQIRDRTYGLKQKDVNTIHTLYESKTYTKRELANMFNVHYNTIRYTLNHRKVGT